MPSDTEPKGPASPGVHRVVSLFKRWLLGTHQGAAGSEHLQASMDEFVFRLDPRSFRSRGMLFCRGLELAVAHEPVRHRDLIADPRPRSTTPHAAYCTWPATEPATPVPAPAVAGDLEPQARSRNWIPQICGLLTERVGCFPSVVTYNATSANTSWGQMP